MNPAELLATLVGLLPASWQPKAKGIAGALGGVVSILTLVLPDAPHWLTVTTIVATALGVYGVPNLGYEPPETKP